MLELKNCADRCDLFYTLKIKSIFLFSLTEEVLRVRIFLCESNWTRTRFTLTLFEWSSSYIPFCLSENVFDWDWFDIWSMFLIVCDKCPITQNKIQTICKNEHEWVRGNARKNESKLMRFFFASLVIFVPFWCFNYYVEISQFQIQHTKCNMKIGMKKHRIGDGKFIAFDRIKQKSIKKSTVRKKLSAW